MHKFLLASLILLCVSASYAQKIQPADMKVLRKKEDSLKVLAVKIIQGETSAERFSADSQFTKIFVRALKVNNSFHYRFDSLISISKLSPPDSSFKIFTWQMIINDNVVRQHGAIQMRTSDGSLKLFPLIDKSGVTVEPEDTVANNYGWIGAVYYTLIQKDAGARRFYTLLGFDEFGGESNKKIIEVLRFENGEPIFGGPYFSMPGGSFTTQVKKRFIMEYKKNASPRLIYDADQDLIVFGHLVSETGEIQRRSSYIPDGEYDGLKWMAGQWVQIRDVGPSKSDTRRQVPVPIRDENGNIDDSKLKDNSPVDAAVTDSIPPQPQRHKVTKRHKENP